MAQCLRLAATGRMCGACGTWGEGEGKKASGIKKPIPALASFLNPAARVSAFI